MSKPFIQRHAQTDPNDPVRITDSEPNDLSGDSDGAVTDIADATVKPVMTAKTPSLEDLDSLFGPLRFGECTVTRKELLAMGATLDGKEITAANTYVASPDQSFIDALEFDPAKVKQRLMSVASADAELVASLLYEVATHRSADAATLFSPAKEGSLDVGMARIGKTLSSVQRLEITHSPQSEQLPDWVDQAKSRTMNVVGVGMQLYGLYSAYRGAIEALKQGDLGEVGINLGGAGAEITSIGVEYALVKTGEQMIRQGSQNMELFSKTSSGKWLARSAGLVAAALTLPFDIYTAIKSFNDAAKTEGKKAQDLYVTGGLSVASGGISLALGIAALMGLKFAGPIGLVAAGLMIAGATIYQAVRVVDDIDDYIELTVGERWRAGWLALWSMEQDAELMDRFNAAKAYSDYEELLKKRSLGWLKKEFKERFEAVYIGRFDVTTQQRDIHRLEWAEGEKPFDTVNKPTIKETDDILSAWDGLPDDNNRVVSHQRDPKKGVFWQLGDGNDQILGVGHQPNHFSLGAGKKRLTGGNKDDAFVFQSAAQTLQAAYKEQPGTLKGGQGTDLLWLQGKHQHIDHGTNPTPYSGYSIDLAQQKIELIPTDSSNKPVLFAHIESIEKVETLAGAQNKVTGTEQADVIAANGDDEIDAGAGNDHLSLRGNHVAAIGGAGLDTYHLHKASRKISIVEDGKDESIVYLGVPMEFVQRWTVQGEALVIHSLRDHQSASPQREVIIKNVYQTLGNQRSLHNAKWVFITADGYYLQPDWPTEITGTEDVTLKVLVIVPGTAKAAPVLLNGSRTVDHGAPQTFYYLDRGTKPRHLRINQSAQERQCTVYADFDSSEIKAVEASYTVSVNKGINTVLSYKSLSFKLTFAEGLLFIHEPMVQAAQNPTDMGGGIMASGWKLLCDITLVMRDGVSYSLDFPRTNVREDARNPGYRLIQSLGSLRPRGGRYICVKPATTKHELKAAAQRIDMAVSEYRSILHFEGRSNTYDLYPSKNVSLQLSTHEGSAASSTWNIYTQNVDERIYRREIALNKNLLEIGSVHVQLPDSENPELPLETLYVMLASGVTYKIHSLFNWIELFAIDASAYASVADVIAEIQQHKKFEPNQLFEDTRVLIQNIHMQTSTVGDFYYIADTDTWELDSDPAQIINTNDLTIKPRSNADSTEIDLKPVKE